MTTTYQIGTSAGALVDINVSHSEVEQEVLGRDLNGAEILSAFLTVKWIIENMPQDEFNVLLSYFPSNGADRFIRTRVESGSTFTYSVFSCKMDKPKTTVESYLGQIRNVEVTFKKCEAV